MDSNPPISPEQLQWVLDHNQQIRGGHRVQIAAAVEAWRAAQKAKEEAQQALRTLTARQGRDYCICAAIKLTNGEVWRGHRHDDAILTAGKAGVSRDDIATAEQGFITSLNRFVGRKEGAELQRQAGIVSAQTGKLPGDMLFSEDLYLRSWREALVAAVGSRKEPA